MSRRTIVILGLVVVFLLLLGGLKLLFDQYDNLREPVRKQREQRAQTP